MANRRIVVVRHGERVDFVFSEKWIKSCFLEGEYRKHNLNMPDSIPKRQDSPQSFLKDCPLTEMGVHQATLTGKGLRSENILQNQFQVYVSPSLRCIETATGIAKGMGIDFQLNVEPGLFEWTGWYSEFMPAWMTTQELSESGFKVDTSYVPFMNASDIEQGEEKEAFYHRAHRVILNLLSRTDKDLLIVGHGVSLDASTRQLVGRDIRNPTDMMTILQSVPYCGLIVAEQSSQTNNWSIIPVPRISMSHHSVRDFDAFKELSSEQYEVHQSSITNIHT